MAYTEKYVTDAGAGSADGSSLANAWSWATMLTSLAAGQRANVQGAITRTTATDTFTNAGTAANPMAVRGINATDGDLEANGRTRGGALVTTNFPVITYTTGHLTLPAYMSPEHLWLTSAFAGGVTVVSGDHSQYRRCKIVNTNNGGSGSNGGMSSGSNYIHADDCDFATVSGYCVYLTRGIVKNSLLVPSNAAASCINMSDFSFAIGNMLRDAAVGINFDGSSLVAVAIENSFRNISGNYINNAGTCYLANNVAWGSGGSSKFYNSTTSVRNTYHNNNAVGNMGAGNTNPGNWPVIGLVTLTADPFTSSTDLTLNSTAGGGAACKAAGYPRYIDIGAWQHQESAATAGGAFMPGGF